MKKIVLLFVTIIVFGCDGNAQKNAIRNHYPVQKSDAEWKSELTPQEYQVLRKKATEPAFASELLGVKVPGTFICAACGNELYKSAHKFDSGTGWPSFDRAYKDENMVYRNDRSFGYSAIEVLCGNCGGHLGHIFNDGPEETTGKRHCINGIALDFVEDQK